MSIQYHKMMIRLVSQMKMRGMEIKEPRMIQYLEMINEYELIQQKKSRLPAIQRNMIIAIFQDREQQLGR
jgi:hypothetical protein